MPRIDCLSVSTTFKTYGKVLVKFCMTLSLSLRKNFREKVSMLRVRFG